MMVRSRSCLLVLLALSFVPGGCGTDADSIGPILERPSRRLYVLNQTDGTMYAYNADNLQRYDSLSAGVLKPHHIEFSPDHQYAYVVNRDNGGQIAKFDLDNDSLISVASGGATQLPTAIAISPGGTLGYVTDFSNQAGRLHIYDLLTMRHIDSSKQSGVRTHDIKITQNGQLVLGCNFGSDNITFYETISGNVELVDVNPARPWLSGAPYYGPYGLALSPDDSTLYIACRSGKMVKVMDVVTRTVTDSVLVPGLGVSEAGPCQMRLTSDGEKLYVTTQYDNSIAVIATEPLQLTSTIPTGIPQPFGLYLSDDQTRLYVAAVNDVNQTGWMYVINTASDTKIDSLSVGRNSYMVHYHDHGASGHP